MISFINDWMLIGMPKSLRNTFILSHGNIRPMSNLPFAIN